MEPAAHTTHRAALLEQGLPDVFLSAGDENRQRVLRNLLAELQDEAGVIFATSGETVDRFLCERRNEARRESGLPA